MTNPQPTIFISSIISEFYDLRGALKYFLGKSGFRVLMSEEPDFGADCGLDSLDNCKKQIEKSDYYLLIVGGKPGTIFKINEGDTSVTYEEFKHYISLVKSGKALNFIAFVRQQTWDAYSKKDLTVIDQLQINLIDELLDNSLFEDKKIGRWRYTFDKFSDIISVLETNQNGLFLDATKKSSIYKIYIKRELTDILKYFIAKDSTTGKLQANIDFLDLPDIQFTDDFIANKYIEKKTAAKIVVFLIVISSKESLLTKINRVFSYIAQGEFSRFNTTEEKYDLPDYIKLAIQTLEILEKIFDNRKNIVLYEQIKNRDSNNFQINRLEYHLVKSLYTDLKIVTKKLINLNNCLHQNWTDIESKPNSFYAYRGTVNDEIKDDELIEFARTYFDTKES
jgi:hypothetical protein